MNTLTDSEALCNSVGFEWWAGGGIYSTLMREELKSPQVMPSSSFPTLLHPSLPRAQAAVNLLAGKGVGHSRNVLF